jgi:exodeoxyribonuclease VII small subunit
MADQRRGSDDDNALPGSELRSEITALKFPEDVGELSEGAEKFEVQLEDLEHIVTRIDSGELSLEESIDAFERGVGLVRSLNRKLDEVERRVEVLMRGTGGDLKSVPHEGEAGPAANGGTTKKSDDEEVPF